MVYVGVGDEDVSDFFASHGVEERLDVSVIIWAGVDDGDFAVSYYVGACASEGEFAGVVGSDPPHQRGDLLRLAVGHLVLGVEQGF